MLQVHPDSTCDVCLDQYVFSNPAKTPHAIACGHIFCLECLAHLNHPTSCPLCRKSFGIDRVKKLHVDRHVPGPRQTAMPGAWSLVQRLARCARSSEVDISSTEELIREGQQWLEADNHKELFPEVDAVFAALIKYKSLQERFQDQQTTIGTLTSRLHRAEATRDEERKGLLVEQGLVRKIKELETQLDYYRQHFPGVRDLAREHRAPQVSSSVSEGRASSSRNPTPGNPLPSPPRPIWHAFTTRNPSFVPPGNPQEPYLRTNIPPIHAQPYAYQTGAGAVYYEGARYEDRVVPQAVRDMAARDGSERERARSRSGHRDRSAERRSRRREGESERDHRHRRRRDRHRRDTGGRDDDEIVYDPTAPGPIGGQPPMDNALGIHPGSHYPAQGFYATAAPPVAGVVHPNDPYQNTSRVGGAQTTTGHGFPPAIATTASVSGSRHHDAPLSAGPETSSRATRTDPRSTNTAPRPSSTPTGHLLAPWAAPDLSNPSLNSLGLSAPPQPDGGPNLRAFPAIPMRLTARDSVSSWGTEDSGPTQGDLFSTLRPLAPAPADGGPPASDLLPRQDGQLLGVGRSNQIAIPRPQHAQAPIQPLLTGDADTRPRSRHSHHSRSGSISQTSVVSNREGPQSFSSEDRGFPYAAIPPPPSFPNPYFATRSSAGTPTSRPPSHPVPAVPPFPYIPAPQPTTAVSRMPQYTQQPFTYGNSSSSLPQNSSSSHRSHH